MAKSVCWAARVAPCGKRRSGVTMKKLTFPEPRSPTPCALVIERPLECGEGRVQHLAVAPQCANASARERIWHAVRRRRAHLRRHHGCGVIEEREVAERQAAQEFSEGLVAVLARLRAK